jgi:3D (Asp-Asp-Asp) domain-containing protein
MRRRSWLAWLLALGFIAQIIFWLWLLTRPAECAPLVWAPPREGAALGRFQFTFYWIADEKEYAGPVNTYLYDDQCVAVASVPLSYLHGIALEGTGRLSDGTLVNFGSRCICSWDKIPCFRTIDEDDDRQFGIGVDQRGLTPFRSVAVDDKVIPIGAHIYVPDLDGVEMPGEPPWGGFVHDGCLIADDRGSAIGNQHLDFFVKEKSYWKQLGGLFPKGTVRVYAGGTRCP